MTRPSVAKVMLLAALLVSPGVAQQLQFQGTAEGGAGSVDIKSMDATPESGHGAPFIESPASLYGRIATSGVAAQLSGAPPKPPPGRSATPVGSLSGSELLAELRKGGYVIYFRHTSTDFSRDDARSRSDDDCDNQRPLTDKGREEARQIGAALRELKIPVEKVLASPRCRTLETAMLAFGRAEKSPEARGGPVDASNPERYAGLHRLLSTEIKPGANLAIASHGNPFYGVAGPPYLAEGEAVVVKPLGKDFEIVARVHHDGWRALQIKN